MADESLARAHAEVSAEISRADSKAGALLTALGVPLAVLVAVVPERHLPTAGVVLVGVATVGFVAAILVVLYVLRPHIGTETQGSFLRWAECEPNQVVTELAEDRRTQQLITRSKIARRKFEALRTATHLTGGSVIVLAAALLVVMLQT